MIFICSISPCFPQEERILFILDFSSSMNETLHGVPKIDLMLSTMREILPKINPNTSIGLRVYGHRMPFTAFDACRASDLVTAVMPGGAKSIENSLSKLKPRGMTPITYSLKQAVRNDFLGFSGKKHIILLTDGGENCDESPCAYVMELIKIRSDIFIDVIAFNINNAEDLEQLQCTALVTRGKFYSANTAGELVKSLNNSVNVQKEVEAKILPNY
ncbi:MAG: VWA domain-containing protein [Heliobacteriaceae bacterium]|nr:VWA domain-containing protein [Heliobacteriaceae bacterium]